MTGFGETLYWWQYYARQWLTGRAYATRNLFVHRPELSRDPDRVLFVAIGLIGDTVMCTPAITEARRLWPRAEFTLLGRQRNCDLLEGCPYIKSVVEAPGIPFSLRQRSRVAKLRAWLRQQDFDVAILLFGNVFAPLLAQSGIPVRVGAGGHRLSPCLTHTYDIGTPRTWGPAERLNALRSLGYKIGRPEPQLWVPAHARTTSAIRLAGLGLQPGESFAVLHPFGSTYRQWWPIERVPDMAQILRSRHGLATVLIGGPETPPSVPPGVGSRVINAAGALSIQELLAVVERADVVITSDSGPFHIAGALRRPLVGLFRSTRPEHAEHYEKALVLLGGNKDCDKLCAWDRCRKQRCFQLESLSVETVSNAVVEVREVATTQQEARLSAGQT